MSLPQHLTGLLREQAYSHPCDAIELVETHISWVLLTGTFAYKVKKPVAFSFVDFSTLARRRHFCDEEVRCNRRFAPSLYLGVVPITLHGDGRVQVGKPGAAAAGEVLDWAVCMRQFPAERQLDRLLERDAVDGPMLARFGRRLAGQHAELPVREFAGAELTARILGPALENFDDIDALAWTEAHREVLARARQGTEVQARRHRELFVRRLETGRIRECHGDLHLSNLVLLDDGVAAFDCLEFNPDLRWIDPQSDVAFLFMDCLVRQRADLAYAFLGGYLDACGDYDGVPLLPFYAAYRSMVRAKVAALRREQAGEKQAQALEQRFARHAAWAADWLDRPPGCLVLTCGLSGSGKSYLAERLAPRLPAIRLRSDVARKARAGLRPDQSARAAVGEGLYQTGHTEAVYDWLAQTAADLLKSGEHVIVDATFLDEERRARYLEMADAQGARGSILYCDAPVATLRERVGARLQAGGDPSDADLTVLARQLENFRPPQTRTVRVDTRTPLDTAALDALADRLRGAA
ncbi:MAG: AAA family ATPase [Gammaproteobacteria bacterium]|nr:AAA family ATPase [Gammaproteobacteria bacterium]